MILGTGVDLAEVHRIRASIERFGDRFIQRIYTAAEIAVCGAEHRRTVTNATPPVSPLKKQA